MGMPGDEGYDPELAQSLAHQRGPRRRKATTKYEKLSFNSDSEGDQPDDFLYGGPTTAGGRGSGRAAAGGGGGAFLEIVNHPFEPEREVGGSHRHTEPV